MSLRAMAAEMRAYRSHVLTLFLNDFRASYRGTTLGVFWNIALPLVPLLVYSLLSIHRVLPGFEDVSAPVYICSGLLLWFLMAGAITQPISIIRGRNLESARTSVPLIVPILSSFARLCFDSLVRLGMVALLMIITGSWPGILLPPGLAVAASAVVFCFGLGLFLGILCVVVPDVDRLTTIILQYGLFLSGVIFPLSALGPLRVLEWVNPFAVFIENFRSLVFHGALVTPVALGVMSLLGLLAVFMGVRVFHVMEQRIRGLT